MTPELVVLLAGRRVGLVSRNPKGRLTMSAAQAPSFRAGSSRDFFPCMDFKIRHTFAITKSS